jgi:hypothetical protein
MTAMPLVSVPPLQAYWSKMPVGPFCTPSVEEVGPLVSVP